MILDTLKKFIIFLKMKKIKKIYIKFHGLGLIRKTVARSFKGLRFKIFKLYDLTSKPHNGCKTRKYKRV
jgi:ribosomal protein S11